MSGALRFSGAVLRDPAFTSFRTSDAGSAAHGLRNAMVTSSGR
jgi:hypothetical protein